MTGQKNRFKTTEKLWDLDDKQLKTPKHDAMVLWLMDKDSQLEIHHILPISEYPSLALDCKNLITLCQKCHRKYHDKYDGNIGAESLIKYAGEL